MRLGSKQGVRTAVIALAVATGVAILAASTAAAGAGGVTGPAFYVDGDLYRTVGTPTDFSNTGAPDHSFDVIYAMAEQTNVAEAAPGDRDYNGGRWQVHAISFVDYAAAVAAYDANASGNFDSAEEIEAALAGGAAVDNGIVRSFECPAIKLPAGGR